MGREAQCAIIWAGESAVCKVQLESSDLVVRGAMRRRAPLASLTRVAVRGDALTFRIGGEEVALELGAKQAESWAKKIAAPPVTLAGKLGIGGESQILVVGSSGSGALDAALAEAASTESTRPEQIVVIAETAAELDGGLRRATACAGHPPIWIVYRKGLRSWLGETAIRDALRSQGFMDVKVAAVDVAWTALRFVRRRG